MIHEGRENNKESKGGFCRARRSGPRSPLMEYQNKAFSYCFLEGKKNPAGVFSGGGGIITEVTITRGYGCSLFRIMDSIPDLCLC